VQPELLVGLPLLAELRRLLELAGEVRVLALERVQHERVHLGRHVGEVGAVEVGVCALALLGLSRA
jgi:hypothetical protein